MPEPMPKWWELEKAGRQVDAPERPAEAEHPAPARANNVKARRPVAKQSRGWTLPGTAEQEAQMGGGNSKVLPQNPY
jgi:hypothetical protein